MVFTLIHIDKIGLLFYRLFGKSIPSEERSGNYKEKPVSAESLETK